MSDATRQVLDVTALATAITSVARTLRPWEN
jgi:hypothetical protein